MSHSKQGRKLVSHENDKFGSVIQLIKQKIVTISILISEIRSLKYSLFIYLKYMMKVLNGCVMRI